jgi:hypothetical protein
VKANNGMAAASAWRNGVASAYQQHRKCGVSRIENNGEAKAGIINGKAKKKAWRK